MISPRDLMRDKRVAAVLAALAVLFVVYWLYPRGTGPAPAPAAEGIPAPQDNSLAAAAASPLPGAPSAIPAQPVSWKWDRNPFLPQWKDRVEGGFEGERIVRGPENGGGVPAGGGSDVPSGLRGTVLSGNLGIAVFGDRLVPVGGKVGEWTVERVDPYGVALRNGREVRVVELFKPSPSGVRGKGGDR